MPKVNASLEHFTKLARRGASGAASGGEQRAHRIAKALLEDCAGLDDAALAGLCQFAQLASSDYYAAERLLGEVREEETVA